MFFMIKCTFCPNEQDSELMVQAGPEPEEVIPVPTCSTCKDHYENMGVQQGARQPLHG